MKRHQEYSLVNIEGHYILMPIGQAIETMCKDVEINEVGAFIWEQMKEDTTVEDIARACMKEYECPESEYLEIKKVVEGFLDSLNHADLLDARAKAKGDSRKYINRYKIANIELDVVSDKKIVIPKLNKFELESSEAEFVQIVHIVESKEEIPYDCEPVLGKTENSIFNPDISVDECTFGFRVFFVSTEHVKEVLISKDGATVTIVSNNTESPEALEEIFCALRVSFLYCAQLLGYIAVHSSSILYKGKAWLFSASAGTGKSTHADFWKESYGVEILNGDMNLCKQKGSLIYVYGTPWCGTSGIYTEKSYPLGGIVFLKRSGQNKVNSLTKVKKTTKLLHRLFSNRWNEEQLEINLSEVSKIVSSCEIVELECTKSPEAAAVLKAYIDNLG